jgi:hypothetical protein
MLYFGQPFEVPRIELDHDGQPPRDAVRDLTEKIERAIRDVTLNAESGSELHAARIAEEIFASAEGEKDLGGELEFQREFLRERSNDESNANEELHEKINRFDARLAKLGLESTHLSLAIVSQRSVIREALRYAWKLILLAPFALLGAILHFPAYQLCSLFSRWYASHGADDVASTAKVLAGMIFMPLTWILAAAAVFYVWRSPIALLVIPVGFLLGYAALYTLEEIAEAGGWANAIFQFLLRREKFLRLFVERRELQEQIKLLRT